MYTYAVPAARLFTISEFVIRVVRAFPLCALLELQTGVPKRETDRICGRFLVFFVSSPTRYETAAYAQTPPHSE